MNLKISSDDDGKRIDKLLAEFTGITRSQIQILIEKGFVTVFNKPVKQNYKVKSGDEVEVNEPERDSHVLLPEDIPVEILYCDEHIAVINKPPNMVVYPAPGNPHGTLMNALLYKFGRLSNIGAPLRPGVVHRLDKDTSGVMVVALSDMAYYSLVEQFKGRKPVKNYITLLSGVLKADKGVINQGIGRSESDRKKMSTKSNMTKEAETRWDVLEKYNGACLVRVGIMTGRTHQIRVHFFSTGHPVLGDRLYGKKLSLGSIRFPRQMLHAQFLGFYHPATGEYLEFTSPLPDDMENALRALRDNPKS